MSLSQVLELCGLGLGVIVTLWIVKKTLLKIVLLVGFIAIGAGVIISQNREEDARAKEREEERVEAARVSKVQNEQLEQIREQLSDALEALNVSVERLNEPEPLPPQPDLVLHDIYPESWGYPAGTGIPLNLDAAQPFPVTVEANHPMAPCLMSPEALSNVRIAITFPPELQVKEVDQRVWQKWTRGTRTQYIGHFGNVNVRECSVLPIQLEFTPTEVGPLFLTYWVSGVGEKAGGLLPVERTIILNAKQ